MKNALIFKAWTKIFLLDIIFVYTFCIWGAKYSLSIFLLHFTESVNSASEP